MALSQKREIFKETLISIGVFFKMLLNTNLPKVGLVLSITLIGGGALIMFIEEGQESFRNFFSSVWWVLVTITTVGYGDMVPQTSAGKLIASGLILSGVILISTFTATVSSIFVAEKIKEGKGLQKIKYKGHIIVCGAGYIARQTFKSIVGLHEQTPPLVAFIAEIAPTEADGILEHYPELNLKYVRGNWTHEEVLKRAGVLDAKRVIILPDEALIDPGKMDEKTILATITVKALHPEARLMAHIMKRENRVFLQRVNADEILVSDEYSGFLLATNTITTGVSQMVREMLSIEGENILNGVDIPNKYTGKTFRELTEFFYEKGSILIGLIREETPLEAMDVLSADHSALDEFIQRKFEEAGMGSSESTWPRTRLNPTPDAIIDKRDKAVIIQRSGG